MRLPTQLFLAAYVASIAAPGVCAATILVTPGQSIQAAIDSATDGDQILVSPGVYPEVIDFKGKAIELIGQGGAAVTTIDGSGLANSVVTFQSNETASSVLHGFTITGGAGRTLQTSHGNSILVGGGVFVDAGAVPVVRDCIITRNMLLSQPPMGSYGGGVYAQAIATFPPPTAKATFTDCVISQNHADSGGGGACGTLLLSDCSVDGNSSYTGGGVCGAEASMTGCIVSGNAATIGGGVSAGSGSDITDCVLIANSAASGGGISLTNTYAATLNRLTLLNNTATFSGGGASILVSNDSIFGGSARASNCIVAGNQAPTGAGLCITVSNSSGSLVDLKNCTVFGNAVSVSATILRVTDSILWNHGSLTATGSIDVRYCDVQGGWSGIGNIDADPLFVNPAAGDFRLSGVASPCYNTGDPAVAFSAAALDLESEPRVQGGRLDIGADEATVDCDGNGIADYQDIAAGTHVDCDNNGIADACQPPADCNGNGIFDACDLAAGISTDCNKNGLLDVCEPYSDCNGNGTNDLCDLAGSSTDCNGNGIPDECDIASGTSLDVDRNGTPDECHGILLVPSVYPTIQAAIDAANWNSHDTVIVADGIYTGTGNCNLDTTNKLITVRSQNGPAHCVIDCQGTAQAFVFNGSWLQSTVRGFTLRNGRGQSGGAVLCKSGASPTLRDCVFTANVATASGGAILCREGASPVIENCVFTANSTLGQGGAVACTDLARPIVRQCSFYGNKANGGAFSIGGGGALDVSGSAELLLENCILWANMAPFGAELRLSDGAVVTVQTSDVAGGQAAVFNSASTLNWGAGNITADPLFVEPLAGDVHLQAGSPCIDAGTGSVAKDFEGDPGSGIADLGADQFHPHLYTTGSPVAGATIAIKLIGAPNATPLFYLASLNQQSPPLATAYGSLHVGFPLLAGFPVALGSIPANGVLIIPVAVPVATPAGITIYTQGFAGSPSLLLTNLDAVTTQ